MHTQGSGFLCAFYAFLCSLWAHRHCCFKCICYSITVQIILIIYVLRIGRWNSSIWYVNVRNVMRASSERQTVLKSGIKPCRLKISGRRERSLRHIKRRSAYNPCIQSSSLPTVLSISTNVLPFCKVINESCQYGYPFLVCSNTTSLFIYIRKVPVKVFSVKYAKYDDLFGKFAVGKE